MLTGLDIDGPNTENIELGILCIINLLGMMSICLKKIIEKRKIQQVLPNVNVIAIATIHQPQELSPGISQQSCFNNVAFNKPLLPLLLTIAFSMTMVTFYCAVFIIRYFEPDEDSKVLTTTYYRLLMNIAVDFVIPLFCGLCNRDYRKHVRELIF